MTSKMLYSKFIGLLLVILGFSYCMTSFYNFYSYIYGDIQINNGNIFLMSIGLLVPLFMFIFGVYFYLYADKDRYHINTFILISSIIFMLCGVITLLLKNNIILEKMFLIAQIVQFNHFTLGYVDIVMGLMILIGCIKYKY